MKVGSFGKLDGAIEADARFVGNVQPRIMSTDGANCGRGPREICAVGIKQRDGDVRTRGVKDNAVGAVQREVRDTIQESSDFRSDSHKSYTGVDDRYVCTTAIHRQSENVNGHACTIGIENC